jgi:ParB-like chromosome segregation protein Spo0J
MDTHQAPARPSAPLARGNTMVASEVTAMMREPHPFTLLIPRPTEQEYIELRESIRRNGLRHPITLHADGRILDGVTRNRACDELGIDPPFQVFGGTDAEALEFVYDQNVHRRHLSIGQRAMIAAEMATLPPHRPGSAQTCAVTQEQAATETDTSRRLVQSAHRILKRGAPELIAAVKTNLMTINAAEGILSRSPEAQRNRVDREQRKADGTHRPEDDWYRTPDATTDAVLDALIRDGVKLGKVLEPACGDGAISKRLEARGYVVISTDLHDHGYGRPGVNFLTMTALPDGVVSMMTNPPYGDDLDTAFAIHALDLGARHLVLLCRLGWVESPDRYARLFSRRCLKTIYSFSPRQTIWRGNDAFPETTGGMERYAWFHFDRNHSGRPEFEWLGV